MSNVIKLEELAREMLSVITKALNIKEAKLLFQDISSGDFVTQFTYPALGGELASEIKFNADNPIVNWIGKTDTPLNVSLIEKVPEFKGLWQSEKEQIAASNTRLICPIKNDGNLVGILALGRKEPDALYSQEDLEVVTMIASQAGTMIDNA
jgi:GAF domain-containing protein